MLGICFTLYIVYISVMNIQVKVDDKQMMDSGDRQDPVDFPGVGLGKVPHSQVSWNIIRFDMNLS